MKQKSTIQNEHHVYDDKGKDVGILFIDTDSYKGIDLWSKVDQLMVEYARVFPNELRVHLWETSVIRKTRRDRWAATKDKRMRMGASIPPALYFKLQALEPDIFNNKKLFHKFMKRYKGFTIPENI